MTIEIRLNLIIMNFNGDLLLKHINMMLKIKKTIYRWMSKSNMMFTKMLFTRMPFIKKRNFIIIIVSIKKFRIWISWKHISLWNSYNFIAIDFVTLISYSTINYINIFVLFITNLGPRQKKSSLWISILLTSLSQLSQRWKCSHQ